MEFTSYKGQIDYFTLYLPKMFTIYNPVYSRFRYAVFLSQHFLRDLVGNILSFNVSCLFVSKDSVGRKFTSPCRVAFSFGRISPVTGCVSDIKMDRITTWRIIAMMTNPFSFWDRLSCQFKCNSMRLFAVKINLKRAMAKMLPFSNPRPTFFESSYLDTFPEFFRLNHIGCEQFLMEVAR